MQTIPEYISGPLRFETSSNDLNQVDGTKAALQRASRPGNGWEGSTVCRWRWPFNVRLPVWNFVMVSRPKIILWYRVGTHCICNGKQMVSTQKDTVTWPEIFTSEPLASRFVCRGSIQVWCGYQAVGWVQRCSQWSRRLHCPAELVPTCLVG